MKLTYFNKTICLFVCFAFSPQCQLFAQQLQDSALLVNEVLLREVQIQHSTNKQLRSSQKQTNVLKPIDKLLEDMQGVAMLRRGNFAPEPTVRGLNAGQINLTIDGMHIFGACTDRMDPISSYVEPSNLKGIQMSLGPNANIQNAGIGGGFNFKLNRPRPDSGGINKGFAGIGFESNGLMRKVLGGYSYTTKQYALGLNMVYRKAENYIAGGGKKINFSQYEKWNLGLSTSKKMNEHNTVFVDYLQDEGYNIGYPALQMDVSFAKAKIASFAHEFHCSHRAINHWENKVYFNYIDHAMDDTKRPAAQVPIHMDMPGTSQTWGFYSKANLQKTKQHLLSGGINFYSNQLHAEMTMYPTGAAKMFMLTIPDAQRNSFSFNANDKVTLGKGTTLELGVTVGFAQSKIYTSLGKQTLSSISSEQPDKNKMLGNLFVQASKKLNGNWSVSGGVAFAQRAATLKEMYGFYLFNQADGFDYIGNFNLKNEQSFNINISSSFKSKKLQIEPQVYLYAFNNYIIGKAQPGFSVMTIGALGVKQYKNISKAKLFGAEANLVYQPGPNIKLSSQSSIGFGLDEESKSLPLIPPFKNLSKLGWDNKGWLLDATMEMNAAQQNVDLEKYGETATKGFAVFSVGLGKRFIIKNKTAFAQISIENIADKSYAQHLDILKIPRPGRNLSIHLSYGL